jgi:hypothetical protein
MLSEIFHAKLVDSDFVSDSLPKTKKHYELILN